jgi:DNA-nicking Smr family endonuclease
MDVLDLHGIKHADVQKVLDSFLFENMKHNKKKVEIITGLSEQMKIIVKNVLEDYSFDFEQDFINPGKIIVHLV